MRIARLILGRYGHLSDMELEFPREHGLHIVLGGNEAGKSTALAAMGDCLFGFPHRTHFDFLHRARDLRIGIALRAQDGREDIFYRRTSPRKMSAYGNSTPRPTGRWLQPRSPRRTARKSSWMPRA